MTKRPLFEVFRILFLASILVNGHCDCSHFLASSGTASAPVLQQLQVAKKGGAKNSYVAARAKKNGAGATLRVPITVYAPFRVECRLGDFSKKNRDWGVGGSVGVSVHDPAVIAEFFGIQVQKDGDDLLVFPAGNDTVRLTNTRVADVAIEHTGTAVEYYTRVPLTDDWIAAGSSATTYMGPFKASMDVLDLKKKAEVGLDDVNVVSSADPPGPLDAEETALLLAERGIHSCLRALMRVDAGVSETVAASADLAAADSSLQQAEAALGTATSNTKKPLAALKGARKKIAAAKKKLDGGKPAHTTVNLIRKAIQKIAQGMDKTAHQ